MENRINRLIWEAKKSGKPVNPWAICTSSVGGKIGDTKRTDWTKDQKERRSEERRVGKECRL